MEQTGNPPVGAGIATPAARRLIEAMPKAELHLHLDGGMRVATALALAASRRVDAPRSFAGMFGVLVAPPLAGTQAALLEAFELPIALMQDAEALERVTFELVEDKAADHVRYVEIKWAPALHVRKGLTLDEGIGAVCRGARAGAAATGTVVRLSAVAVRSHEPAANVEVARAALRHRDAGVSSFDLAGPEAAYPDPLVHADAFAAARAGGLGITVHAGELPDGGAGVWRALELEPARIAHGSTAVDDSRLVAELARRGVTLDLCPTSNVQAGTTPSLAAHPIARLARAGVPVTISTDDLTISDVTLSEEILAAHVEIGLTLPELWRLQLHALDAAFAEPEQRAALRAPFEAWAARIPELGGVD